MFPTARPLRSCHASDSLQCYTKRLKSCSHPEEGVWHEWVEKGKSQGLCADVTEPTFFSFSKASSVSQSDHAKDSESVEVERTSLE